MSIKYAILGLLSRKPSTGYDLKKIIEESPILYWSGNNNQIYKTLLQLVDEGLATSEVQYQESSPSKKIYTVTKEGLAELKEWVASPPEAPEFKSPFLLRLAWADLLNPNELNSLLAQYEKEARLQLIMRQEQMRRSEDAHGRTPREKLLWGMIAENIISSCQNELDWVRKIRTKLFNDELNEEKSKMNYKIVGNEDKKYIELIAANTPISTEDQALDLVALCGEHDAGLLMIRSDALSEDFFKLGTGVAGRVLQKLINYRIRTAVVIPGESEMKGKFRDMALEANRGNQFRVFDSAAAAEKWLMI